MKEQQDEFKEYQKDIDYAETHREGLLNQYPEQWVAILSETVLGAGSDVYRLIDELREKGIPTERVVLRHLTQEEELLIL